MRVSLDQVRRWWAHGHNGNRNGDGRLHTPPPLPQDPLPAPDPPWLARLDRAGIPRTLQYPSTHLGRLLDQTADRFGDCLAIAYHNARWTYHELLAQTNRLAAGLASLGVRRGERVLMTLPNCPEFITTFFAIQKLGATVVNVGPLMGQDDLRHAIQLARPRVAIGVDLRTAHLVQAAEGEDSVEHFVWVSLQPYQRAIERLGYQFKLWQSRENGEAHRRVDHLSMAELLRHSPSRPPNISPDLDATAVLQPTGGTTGSLKLARLTHRSLLANCTQVSVWMNLRPAQDRLLAVLPMFHVYGLTMGLLSSVFAGSEMVLMTRFNGPEALELLREHRVTIFPLVPAICDELSKLLEAEETMQPLKDLRLCVSGAAPLPGASADRFRKLTGACIVEGYGLTEASPVTHAGLPSDPRVGTIGLPMPDTHVRVVDPQTGRDVGPETEGELLITGPQLMAGYLGDPQQTKNALRPDAKGTVWLHTGDIVQYDADGFFHVVDRKKDMINHAGLKIYPSRVEAVIRSHSAVRETAVVGRAHPVHTESVVAIVVLNEPAEDGRAMENDLKSYCRKHLAPYEVPVRFEFVEALPKSALGKVLKKNLREGPAEAEPIMRVNGNGRVHSTSNGDVRTANEQEAK